MDENSEDDITISEVVEYVFANYRIPRLFLVEQPDDLFSKRFRAAAQKHLTKNNAIIEISDMKLTLISDMCRYYLNHMETFNKSTMKEHVNLIDAILKR